MNRSTAMARVNGTRLHFQRAGRGADIVMVHGLAANLAFWYLKLVPGLVRSRRVTVYDLKGHGRSDMPPRGYSPTEMAKDLGGLLDALEIERADIVGHSFGGAVALEYAARHPERVRSLTLADATVYALQPIDSGRDWRYWGAWRRELEALGITVPSDLPKVAYGLLEEIADPRWRLARQRRPRGDFFVPFGLWNGARRTAERWLRLLRTTEAWKEIQQAGLGVEDLRRIPHPTLLIFGERSRWLETCRTLQRHLPRAQTVIVPGAGHFFPLLRPTVFLHHVHRFLDGPVQATAFAPSTVGRTV
jgi:pimeloyl-ACP methyl ester carboxylesterase